MVTEGLVMQDQLGGRVTIACELQVRCNYVIELTRASTLLWASTCIAHHSGSNKLCRSSRNEKSRYKH